MASTGNDQSRDSSIARFSYDVFLSFRGADARKGFVSHLYDALDRSGIKTFMDDQELPTGEDISPKLLQAIQGSRASIIVFSQNYASSPWCLQELVEILECKRTKGHIVIPLYYDVDTPVIRRQTGKFAEAFEKHTTRVSKQKVHKWRAALQEVADLKGHVLANEDNGNEARFIHNIVDKVQVQVILRSSHVKDSLIEASEHSNRNFINKLLSIGSNDVRMIGIYGMGGIGKSTVSKALFYEHKYKFDCSAVAENIKDVSKQADGLLHLQVRLLSQLEKKDVKLDTIDEGTNRIKRICESRKVLILLDDFDHFNQINKLEIHKGWLSTAGSRAILVTRNAQLLIEAHVQQRHTYEMKLLNEDDSLKLFRKHAIEEEENPTKDQESLSSDIAKSCVGLPLSLEVIGRHLRGRDLTYWKNALEDLQSKPPEDVHSSLKISYDALDKDGKNVFLDAACFFIGWKKEYLIQFWGGCGFSKNSVANLTDRCLFKFDEDNCLWMHDHLRDMGRAIVREGSEGSLEKQSRVWIPEEVDDLLRSQATHKTAVEGIQNVWHITVEAKAFEIMFKLRFLEINGTHILNVNIIGVNISGSFENVFRELRWLTWIYCPLDNLPLTFHSTKLIGLDMRDSKIRKLREGVKQFPNLKILDLSYCQLLEETPDFTGTPNLEHLILEGCFRLSRIHPSIEKLTSLIELQLDWCRSLEEIPYSIGKLEKLFSLQLFGCEKLKSLPTSICSLRSLKELDVRRCSNLKELPERLGNLKNLLILKVRDTPLEELPYSIGDLTDLVELNLNNCKNLKTLPDSICDLTFIQVLSIDNCSLLQRFPDRLGDMVSLKEFHALDVGCKHLPDSIKNLMELETLSISQRVPQLNDLSKKFVMPSNSSLKSLTLNNCGLHDEDITDVIWMELSSLRSMNLSGNNFCNPSLNLHPLSNLTKLYLSKCKNLVSLPQLPPNLEVLDARGCTSMMVMPNLTNVQFLRELNLGDCNSLVELQGLENLKQLRSLELAGCNSLARNANINGSFFQRFFEYGEECSLPKWEIPDWIKCQSRESTITFQLPPTLPHNFKGIILWLLIDRESSFYFADIRNNTSGEERKYYKNPLGYHFKVSGTWVWCIKESDRLFMRSEDSITISIIINMLGMRSDGGKVVRFGVDWWTGSESNEALVDHNHHL